MQVKYTNNIPSSVLIKNQIIFVKPTPSGLRLLKQVLDWFKVPERKSE